MTEAKKKVFHDEVKKQTEKYRKQMETWLKVLKLLYIFSIVLLTIKCTLFYVITFQFNKKNIQHQLKMYYNRLCPPQCWKNTNQSIERMLRNAKVP